MTEPIALVFSMGKVGSSTVMEAFRQVGRAPERGYYENLDYLQPLDKYEVVVIPVRDPIARNLSWFFEVHGERLMGLSMREIYGEMVDLPATAFSYPLRWFDEIFEPTFGLKVYRHRFDRKRGWSIYKKHILIVQTERMTEVLPEAFESLFGKRPESVHRANTEATRPYGELYAQFCQWVHFPSLFYFYQSRYVKHFYTREQIEEMEAKWTL